MSTISSGLAGARTTGANNYLYGYAPAQVDNIQQMPILTGLPQDGLYSPAYQQQQQAVQDRLAQIRAEDLQYYYGYTPKRSDLNSSEIAGYSPNANYMGVDTSGGYPSGAVQKGSRTGLNPQQIGRALANYMQGNYRGDSDALYKDYAELTGANADLADREYKTNYTSSPSGKTGGVTNPPRGAADMQQKIQEVQKQRPTPPPVSYPSYSGNPAGGYTNVTPLGPMGPVTIQQNKPADLGWSTGSAYDPNTGLSKWSTSGLTNGEAYYDNWNAAQMQGENQMKAANAAQVQANNLKKAQQMAGKDRADAYVELLKQTGEYNPAAQFYSVSPEMLAEKQTQVEQLQQTQSEQQLNDLISQFSNPGYSTGGNMPYMADTAYQATAAPMSREQMEQAIQDAYNNPNLSQAEKNQAISNAQRAYSAGQGEVKRQAAVATAGGTGTGGDPASINQQYQQAVQQQQLSQQYQQAQDQAQAANQARYDDIVAGYQNNQQNISDYLTNQGNQQTSDINRSYDRLGANNEQDLISRGLGNTTVRSSTQRGIQEDRQRALQNSQEQIDRQRLGYETAAQQGLLDFMERRTDQGPDYNQLIGLSQGLGNSAGGGQGGVGTTGGYTNPGQTGQGGSGYTNPATGQSSTGGYTPIYNAGSQGQQGQQSAAPQPQYSPPGQSYANGQEQQANEDPVAWANRVTGHNQATNATNNAANVGMQAGTGGGVVGSPHPSSIVNPWTQPQQAQKAGQINQQQQRVNMLSSGVTPYVTPNPGKSNYSLPTNAVSMGQGAYHVPGAQQPKPVPGNMSYYQ